MKTNYIHFTFAPLIIILAVLLLAISCKKENKDNNDNPTPPILPECKIIIPDDSSMVQIGSIVSVEASIIGFSSDAKVAFSIDTSTISETSTGPYNFQWDPVIPGIYKVAAAAVDNGGDTVFTKLNHVSRSGMTRSIEVMVFRDIDAGVMFYH